MTQPYSESAGGVHAKAIRQHAEVVRRLERSVAECNSLRATLRELAAAEGDTSLPSLVAAWRSKALGEAARAEHLGTRAALAERLLRQLLVGRTPSPHDVHAWQQAAKDDAA